MTAITIRRDSSQLDTSFFRAAAGGKEAVGRTMGEAVDALTADWGDEIRETSIKIERFGPDAFFTQAQHDRMQDLMARCETLAPQERQELESLVYAELDAAVTRLEHLDKSSQP